MRNLIDALVMTILAPFVQPFTAQRAVVHVRKSQKDKAPWKG